MPQDLYQWEVNGGLVHHCPICYKPLTTPQARTRCLGEHVEWCKRYHTQLFKKGSSGQCAPCRTGDEEHIKRHRDIAETVHKLAMLNSTIKPKTTIATQSFYAIQFEDETTPKKKKERKAAKRAKKIAELPKLLTAADVEHIGKVLHPEDHDADECELELKILNDQDIKDNRFFHKGTSNLREVRNIFVKKDRKADRVTFRVETEEMEGLLQLLNISPITAASSSEEKKLLEELKAKIEADLGQAQKELEELQMRKGGFWRWASKKAYNRLVANGRIWEDKGDVVSAGKSDESAASSEGDAVFSANSGDVTDDTNITEPDTEGVGEVMQAVEGMAVSTPKAPKTPKNLTAVSKAGGDDDGWTSVGSKAKNKGSGSATWRKATPQMTLKLTSNNGLSQMVQSSTPRKTAFLGYHGEEN